MYLNGGTLVGIATSLATEHWVQIITSVVLFLGVYHWTQRVKRAAYAPSEVFVPSTSTYPSRRYTSQHKIPAQQILTDFIRGHIELRDAQSGQGLENITDVVSFGIDPLLAWRISAQFLLTSHSERRSKEYAEQYVLQSDALLEEVLGPDRLSLVGYVREGVPDQLETCLSVQMERIAKEYLNLTPDDRLLDANAQWGDLAVYLAQDYQVPTCAVVNTPSQLAHASNLACESQAQKLLRFVTSTHHSTLNQCVLRGVPLFTKVLALDFLDMVGSRNILASLQSLNNVTEQGSRLLLQVTTSPSSIDTQPTVPEDPRYKDSQEIENDPERTEHWWYHWFRQQYIQPGADTSMLVSIEQIMADLQAAGFEVLQVESLTTDAAMTMAVWSSRLCAAKRQVEVEMGVDTFRTWELYLNWTQSMYARGRLFKHFIMAIKK